MRKITLMLMAMMFIAFGYSAGAYAGGMDKSMGKAATDVVDVSFDLLGKDVRNTQGEDLGDISNFIWDEEGEEVLFVIVSIEDVSGAEEKDIAVPMTVVSIKEDHIVLDATSEQLANAPELEEENMNDPAYTNDVHAYFGVPLE